MGARPIHKIYPRPPWPPVSSLHLVRRRGATGAADRADGGRWPWAGSNAPGSWRPKPCVPGRPFRRSRGEAPFAGRRTAQRRIASDSPPGAAWSKPQNTACGTPCRRVGWLSEGLHHPTKPGCRRPPERSGKVSRAPFGRRRKYRRKAEDVPVHPSGLIRGAGLSALSGPFWRSVAETMSHAVHGPGPSPLLEARLSKAGSRRPGLAAFPNASRFEPHARRLHPCRGTARALCARRI